MVTFLGSRGASQALSPVSRCRVPGAERRQDRAKVNTDSAKYKTNTSRYRSTNTLGAEEGRSQQSEEGSVGKGWLGPHGPDGRGRHSGEL